MITAEAALLRVLINGEAIGLELTTRVREWTNGKLMLDDQSFYAAVRTLEEQGLVTSFMSEPAGQRGGQPRRYYKLTAAGQRAALEVLTASLTGQV
jgi:DNA-binding PadR family transcriptional regulator